MFFKQSSRNIGKHILGYFVDQVLFPGFNIIVFFSLVHRQYKQLLNILQRILVHINDQPQIFDHKEQNRPSFRNLFIAVSSLIDFLLHFYRLFYFLVDFSSSYFRSFQSLDQTFIIQQLIAFSAIKQLQYIIFTLYLLLPIVRKVYYILV